MIDREKVRVTVLVVLAGLDAIAEGLDRPPSDALDQKIAETLGALGDALRTAARTKARVSDV